jgi:hypothetical protein
MKVSNFTAETPRLSRKDFGGPRPAMTYRGARRNMGKLAMRAFKKAKGRI